MVPQYRHSISGAKWGLKELMTIRTTTGGEPMWWWRVR